MEEIRNLETEFKNLLKQANTDVHDYVESVIREKHDLYIRVKDLVSLKSKWQLVEFILALKRKLLEYRIQLHEYKEQNEKRHKIKQTTKIIHDYVRFTATCRKELDTHNNNTKKMFAIFLNEDNTDLFEQFIYLLYHLHIENN